MTNKKFKCPFCTNSEKVYKNKAALRLHTIKEHGLLYYYSRGREII